MTPHGKRKALMGGSLRETGSGGESLIPEDASFVSYLVFVFQINLYHSH